MYSHLTATQAQEEELAIEIADELDSQAFAQVVQYSEVVPCSPEHFRMASHPLTTSHPLELRLWRYRESW